MTYPLRILYLIGQLGLGGSERQLHLLLKHMDKTRFEPHVVVFNPSNHYTLDDDLRAAGVTVHAVPLEIKSIPSRVAWLYQLLRRVRPHILHSWSVHDNVYAGIVGWMARVPRRLGSVRDSIVSPEFLQFSPFIRWLILHAVQSHLVNSEAIARELRAARVPAHRIRVLPNCVETSSHPATALKNLPPGARLIGMVANLRRKKNHVLFVRALAQILPEFPNVRGVMVGQAVPASDPEIPAQVQAEIEAQGVEGRVWVEGFRADVASILPNFEIFCLPSNYEGTPNAVLEAMAAGLPVVATRVGGIPRLVLDGETGLLVSPGDIHALASALRTLLHDPARARRMGESGRARVEAEFSCGAVVRQFEEYYLSQFGNSPTDGGRLRKC